MLKVLWLMPAIPFSSSLLLVLFGPRFAKKTVELLGVGSIALAAAVSITVSAAFLSARPPGDVFSQTLWTWMSVAGFQPRIGLYLDAAGDHKQALEHLSRATDDYHIGHYMWYVARVHRDRLRKQ